MYPKVYKYTVPSLVHPSIDSMYLLWYNVYVIKDNPISTQPVVSPFKHKGAVAAGETATTLLNTKEIPTMSKIELLAKIELLNKYEAMMEELKGEADTIRNSIKAEMEAREVEELIAGQYIVRWTSVLSNRFDSTSFKKVLPELYQAYTKQVSSRRFTISV